MQKRRTRSLLLAGALALVPGFVACGWSPSRPFDRESPEVNEALRALDAGDATVAATTLEDYLSTGPCSESNIGTPALLQKRPNGSFDLGLSLFKMGEAYGRRFGEEESDAGGDEKQKALRSEQVGCAIRILGVIGSDPSVPTELRARARYLEGNLNFLDSQYKDAVAAYDKALAFAPGESDGGDPIGRDAAWNRAIALKRIDDEKDSGQDSGNDSGGDSGKDGGGDAASDGGSEGGGDSGGKDSGSDSSQSPDSGDSPDSGQPPPPEPQPDAAPPPPRANEDERMLEQLENAPTVQQEAMKKMAARHKVRGTADK